MQKVSQGPLEQPGHRDRLGKWEAQGQRVSQEVGDLKERQEHLAKRVLRAQQGPRGPRAKRERRDQREALAQLAELAQLGIQVRMEARVLQATQDKQEQLVWMGSQVQQGRRESSAPQEKPVLQAQRVLRVALDPLGQQVQRGSLDLRAQREQLVPLE